MSIFAITCSPVPRVSKAGATTESHGAPTSAPSIGPLEAVAPVGRARNAHESSDERKPCGARDHGPVFHPPLTWLASCSRKAAAQAKRRWTTRRAVKARYEGGFMKANGPPLTLWMAVPILLSIGVGPASAVPVFSRK